MCSNQGWISNEVAKLWFIDPTAAISQSCLNQRRHFIINLLGNFEAVGFSDGAWRTTDMKSGAGGVIYSRACNISYVISRTTAANNALEAEVQACKLVCEAMGQLNSNHNYALCVDSKNLVKMHEKARARLLDTRKEFDMIKDMFKKYSNVFVLYVNRKWNYDADFLAKQGLENKIEFSKWFNHDAE